MTALTTQQPLHMEIIKCVSLRESECFVCLSMSQLTKYRRFLKGIGGSIVHFRCHIYTTITHR